MKDNAIIITNGNLVSTDAKTAHGLIRGTSRFHIVGVIDPVHAGKDAGAVLDGKNRNIPVYPTVKACLKESADRPVYCIIGVALVGGKLPEDWKRILLEVIENRISVINGLHQPLGDDPDFQSAARRYSIEIIDIRKSPPFSKLRSWSGEVLKVDTPTIAVLGMDCAIGKRTTCRLVTEMCREQGIRAEMIYTGQTGWLQGYDYGFIFDATPNDFICGEIERAIVDCDRETSPDLILIEGQSGLRNPSGPCGSEFLLAGNAKGVILQHAPFRTYYEDLEHAGCLMPAVEDEIELIRMYGAETLAVGLNGDGGTEKELIVQQQRLAKKLQIPVFRPLQEGVRALLPVIRRYMHNDATRRVKSYGKPR